MCEPEGSEQESQRGVLILRAEISLVGKQGWPSRDQTKSGSDFEFWASTDSSGEYRLSTVTFTHGSQGQGREHRLPVSADTAVRSPRTPRSAAFTPCGTWDGQHSGCFGPQVKRVQFTSRHLAEVLWS